MKSTATLAVLAALLTGPLVRAQDPPWQRWDGRRYAVHEWGTFTSVERGLPLSVEPHELWDAARGAPGCYPPADEVVRTFVGRAELLSPRREAALAAAVRAWADGDDAARALARGQILRWGRFAAPYLERVDQLTGDAQVAEGALRELGGL